MSSGSILRGPHLEDPARVAQAEAEDRVGDHLDHLVVEALVVGGLADRDHGHLLLALDQGLEAPRVRVDEHALQDVHLVAGQVEQVRIDHDGGLPQAHRRDADGHAVHHQRLQVHVVDRLLPADEAQPEQGLLVGRAVDDRVRHVGVHEGRAVEARGLLDLGLEARPVLLRHRATADGEGVREDASLQALVVRVDRVVGREERLVGVGAQGLRGPRRLRDRPVHQGAEAELERQVVRPVGLVLQDALLDEARRVVARAQRDRRALVVPARRRDDVGLDGADHVAAGAALGDALGEDGGVGHEEVVAEWSDVFAAWQGSWDIAPPNGESLKDFDARIQKAKAEILSRHAGASVVVVAHVMPIRGFLRDALDAGTAAYWRPQISPCSITAIRFWGNEEAEVQTVNFTAHLS